MNRIKKITFFLNKYKMVVITKETWRKNGVEVIVDKNGTKWLNEKHRGENLKHSSFRVITRKYLLKYRKQRPEFVNCSDFQPCRKLLHEKLAVAVITDCRTAESCKFKRKLGFNLHDVFNTKGQTILELIKDKFEGEKMQTQYYVLGYRIDLYFHDHKLAIEVDEFVHCDRNNDDERREEIEEELDCKFIQINLDEENFNNSKAINEIHRHIAKSTKKLTEKSTKKSLFDRISRRLLQLEFEKNHSMKSKCLQFIVKKIMPSL